MSEIDSFLLTFCLFKHLMIFIAHQTLIFEIVDSEGRTPLHWAVDRGHLNISELLVSKNADVNAKVCWFYFFTFLLDVFKKKQNFSGK